MIGVISAVARVNVILNSLDHFCCGPRREVGDNVTIYIHNYEGQVYEERHPSGVDIATQPIEGVIVGIQRRPAIMREEVRPEGYISRSREGYGPGTPIESTDFDDPDTDDWAFEFTVDTDDPIPKPR
jgi:hypothetical protein